ncbi:MAG: hypothetical protein IBX71_10175, partial [Candidatus Desulforudis sp.]|nr:hypothetical protein [Desulforudis sp.]
QYRANYRQLAERLRSIEEHLKAEHPDAPDVDYSLITLNYGRHLSEALVDWCDETIQTLKKRGEGEYGAVGTNGVAGR